jgi:hypothetical protein
MIKPKFYRGRPILRPGETYDINGVAHKVITATARTLEDDAHGIEITNPLYWLDNLETNERICMSEEELGSEFTDLEGNRNE